jgi:glycosyltransferase involved in cell wall biosynthesis
VDIIVVLDACTDQTKFIAQQFAVSIIKLNARNVGIARAEGATLALASGARWLAFTDADTVVSENWLVEQLRCRADAVCGVIGIEDWSGHSEAVRDDFVTTYRDSNGHRHIHGANLGVSAHAYQRAGGFRPLPSREDIALVEALIASGAHIEWSAGPRVVTSARLRSKAPDGFGSTLRPVSRRLSISASNCDLPVNS